MEVSCAVRSIQWSLGVKWLIFRRDVLVVFNKQWNSPTQLFIQ